MANAGKFKIEISDPSPIWCRLLYDSSEIRGFTADELDDLIYTAQKAKRQAEEKIEQLNRIHAAGAIHEN